NEISFRGFSKEGETATLDAEHVALAESISANYFQTLLLPMLRGREFTDADGPDATRVAIISQAMAERYWPGGEAVGKRIRQGGPDSKNPWLTIVGVAANVKYSPYFPVDGVVYVPYTQSAEMNAAFLLRTQGDPLAAAAAVRAKIGAVDANQPIYEAKSLERLTYEQLSGISFIAGLMGVLGLIALVLA